MGSFYDSQLDFFKRTASQFLSPVPAFSRDEAFLYFAQERPFHFHRGDEFPEKARFAEELQESYRRRGAVGTIFRIRARIRAPWPLPEPGAVDDAMRDAVLIVLVHPGARLITAAADVKEAVPHEPQAVTGRGGEPIPDQSWIPKGPRMSGWMEVGLATIPGAYRSLELMK